MLMAAIGDVLGNFSALEAVRRAIAEMGIETVVQAGDVIGGGSRARKAIESLRESGIPNVQGALGRLLGRFEQKRAALSKRLDAETMALLSSAYETLSSGDLEYIQSLPRIHRMTVDTLAVFVCYGSPASVTDILTGESTPAKFQRQREIEPMDIVISGGAPEPFSRFVNGTLFVGPGPMEAGPGKARYALITAEERPWQVEFIDVDYTAE